MTKSIVRITKRFLKEAKTMNYKQVIQWLEMRKQIANLINEVNHLKCEKRLLEIELSKVRKPETLLESCEQYLERHRN